MQTGDVTLTFTKLHEAVDLFLRQVSNKILIYSGRKNWTWTPTAARQSIILWAVNSFIANKVGCLPAQNGCHTWCIQILKNDSCIILLLIFLHKHWLAFLCAFKYWRTLEQFVRLYDRVDLFRSYWGGLTLAVITVLQRIRWTRLLNEFLSALCLSRAEQSARLLVAPHWFPMNTVPLWNQIPTSTHWHQSVNSTRMLTTITYSSAQILYRWMLK